MTAIVLAIRSSGGDAKEASDRWREILGLVTARIWEVGEKLTYESGNARVVTPGIPASSFDHGGIDGDVQAFLGHGCSYAHDSSRIIRTIYYHFNG
jgi:hypothetical protein